MPPDDSLADAACLSRLVAGDERALGVLYDRHGAMAFGLASAMMHDSADAEEVVADAFAQVWRTAASFNVERGVWSPGWPRLCGPGRSICCAPRSDGRACWTRRRR
ncbi:MAG: hypothetical protein IPF98_23430 [Gemmatimonadetes bacterium]|nr:hypothetical protein [Gemmatimonadota bacterium]